MVLRTALTVLAVCCATASSAHARLAVQLKLEHPAILQYERLDATVNVGNTGQTPLVIMPGSKRNNAVIRFVIEKKRFEPLARIKKGPLVEKLIVPPEKTGSVTLDLSLWYVMAKEGRYIVRAEIDMLGQTYKSNAVMVDVVRGLELLRATRSVRGLSNRIRTYSLRYWARNRGEHLFLRIEDEDEGIIYGLFRLGPVIRIKKPVMKIDSLGYVTVIHQSGPDRFTRSGFMSSAAGVQFIGQVQEQEDGRPYPVPVAPPGLELTPATSDDNR